MLLKCYNLQNKNIIINNDINIYNYNFFYYNLHL